MNEIFAEIAAQVEKHGAPIIAGMIGTAVGGPAGAAIGGLAGKAIEALAQSLGTPTTPEAVLEAVKSPGATAAVQSAENEAALMLPLWQAKLVMAQQAQTAELEKGFGSWDARRNFAHYTTWGLTLLCGGAAVMLAVLGHNGAAAVAGLFSTSIGLTMAWLGVNSGGKALSDFAREWKSK